MKFDFDGLSSFREEEFENYGRVHVYSPRAGVDSRPHPWGQNLFKNISHNLVNCCKFYPLKDCKFFTI